MDEEVLKRFMALGKEMLDIYDKFPQSGSKRKIMCAHGDNPKNMLIFFQGTPDDAFELQKFLNEREFNGNDS